MKSDKSLCQALLFEKDTRRTLLPGRHPTSALAKPLSYLVFCLRRHMSDSPRAGSLGPESSAHSCPLSVCSRWSSPRIEFKPTSSPRSLDVLGFFLEFLGVFLGQSPPVDDAKLYLVTILRGLAIMSFLVRWRLSWGTSGLEVYMRS
jgi:hypothetical protein